MARVFLVAEDMGTPPGAIALRGATNFQTPSGWDTVYTPIFNMIERPVAPMLVVRVETDWYAHETVFRYVLQAGEGITVEPQHSDRTGLLRAARADHDASLHERGAEGDRGVTAGVQPSEGRRRSEDLLRPVVQSALPPTEPGAEVPGRLATAITSGHSGPQEPLRNL